MLLFCSHLQGSQYYIGQIRDERFYPEIHGRMSWEGGQLGGPRTLLDANGRRIFFDWVRELRGNERERASGWSGVMTVPRLLSLDPSGHLQIDPVPELEVLRLDPRRHESIDVPADSEVAVEGVGGDCLELAVEIDPREAREVGLKVRRSPGGEEETAVSYDAAAAVLRVDVSRSSLDREIRYTRYRSLQPHLPESEQYVTAQEGPFELAPGELLTLRIFLDRSILEVFANRRQCVTQRIQPRRQPVCARRCGQGSVAASLDAGSDADVTLSNRTGTLQLSGGADPAQQTEPSENARVPEKRQSIASSFKHLTTSYRVAQTR
ncbi:MAG: GH32 C-terminal domain-containing protein [Candidatus Latescibacteria bacterium]|nr:GH32 C-terminal domain-containing protein [Candidatus Latescibacterota bacterium]